MDASNSWVTGRTDDTTALRFDGVDDLVTTAATASELSLPGSTPRTFAGWVQGPEFFEGTDGGVFQLGQNESSRFAFRNVDPLGNSWRVEYGGTERVSAGVGSAHWFHFAVRYDGRQLQLYIDGELRNEAAAPDLWTDDLQPLTMGPFDDALLVGLIDELAIWDLALPADVIASLAEETLNPLTAPSVNREIGFDQDGVRARQVTASATFPGRVTGEIGGDDGTGIHPLEDADRLLNLPSGDPGVAVDVTFDFPLINFFDAASGSVGDNGLFHQDEDFPYDLFLDDDDHFVLQAIGNLIVPAESAGEFRFAVHSDEGSRLRIDGVDVLVDDNLHPPQQQITDTVSLAAGTHTLELVYFERTGVAEVELLYQSMTDGWANGDWQLLEILPELQPPTVPPSVLTAERVYITKPTPGSANSDGSEVFLGNLEFSHEHGFYQSAIALEISSRTPGATIYYTLDGTEPLPENPTSRTYASPLSISSTTVVRAKAFLPNVEPSKTATASYLFVNDIVRQSPNGETPAGFPNSWGANVEDYGMDPAIVDSPTWGPRMETALTSIPSVSMVMDTDDLFGSRGIYSNAGASGRAWDARPRWN